MPTVRFTDADIKAGFLVRNPGRYQYEISKITVKPAKTDGSPNYLFQFAGLDGEMQGVVVFVQISSKAGWLLAPIIKACNGGKDLLPDAEYEIMDCEKCRISAMTVRGQRDDGSQFNNLVDYAPVS